MGKRGYFGIGILNGKTAINIGTLLRSAYNFNADFAFIIGKRYKKESSDTVKMFRHIPLLQFANWEDFRKAVFYDCMLIGVELCEQAVSICSFTHPERAIYLLGPEDGSIPKNIQEKCQKIIKIPSRRCLNVSMAGTVVMYDRMLKSGVQD